MLFFCKINKNINQTNVNQYYIYIYICFIYIYLYDIDITEMIINSYKRWGERAAEENSTGARNSRRSLEMRSETGDMKVWMGKWPVYIWYVHIFICIYIWCVDLCIHISMVYNGNNGGFSMAKAKFDYQRVMTKSLRHGESQIVICKSSKYS